MAEVTVLVPAYRSAPFIAKTLRTVVEQTFTDFVVDVRFEPDGAGDAIAACRPFTRDPRFRFTVNQSTLGWDGNIRALLRGVQTPYFTILPHDDGWHARYIEALLLPLKARPDASVAYADSFLFGGASGLRVFDLPDARLADRVIAFFLAGAEGAPWRGVTRSTVLGRDFPGNEYDAFAVECEWAFHLVGMGVALRVREPLYLKRSRVDEDSVSAGWRRGMPLPTLRHALDHHRARLLEAVAQLPLGQGGGERAVAAAETAMLRRWVMFSRGVTELTADHQERADSLVGFESGHPRIDGAIRSRAFTALAHDAIRFGRAHVAQELAESAIAQDPSHWEARIQLARALMALARPFDALTVAAQAATSAPMTVEVTMLQAECTKRVERRLAAVANPLPA